MHNICAKKSLWGDGKSLNLIRTMSANALFLLIFFLDKSFEIHTLYCNQTNDFILFCREGHKGGSFSCSTCTATLAENFIEYRDRYFQPALKEHVYSIVCFDRASTRVFLKKHRERIKQANVSV